MTVAAVGKLGGAAVELLKVTLLARSEEDDIFLSISMINPNSSDNKYMKETRKY